MERYNNIPTLSRKQFLETMLVMVTAGLVDAICGVIDGIFVGRFLGEEALAAHGIAMPVFEVLCIFSYIITVGFQQPCTVYIGKGEKEHANGLFSAAMLMTLGVATLVAVLGLLFTHPIAHLMGAPRSGAITDMTADYLKAVFLATPLLLLYLSLIPVLQLDGRRKLVYLSCLLMAVSDVAMDLLNATVFHGGMWGFGMATFVSYLVGLLVLLAYFLKKDRLFHWRPKAIRDSRPIDILITGLPTGIRLGAHSVALIGMNALVMGMAGATAMAAFAVQQNLATMLLSVGLGLSGATLLFSGISFGEQDRRGLTDVLRLSGYSCIVIVGIVGLSIFALAKPLVALYLATDEASFTLAVHAVQYLALSLPLITWVYCIGCYEQGIGHKWKATWVFLGQELFALLPCAFIMGKLWGAEGIFASFAASQLVVILSMGIYAYLRRDRHFSGMEAFLDVPTDFGVPPQDRLVRTLQRREEVCALAAEAHDFCESRGLSSAKAYLVSMYIEEMGNIIMLYGFADGKSHHLEIRLSLYREKVILRFCDDCRRFDFTERAAHWQEDPEHPETSIGVRMVMNSSGLLRYDNSLSTNNLIVQI